MILNTYLKPDLKGFLAMIWMGFFLLQILPETMAQKAINVPSVSITVSDLDYILPFYTEVLNFKLLSRDKYSGLNQAKLLGIKEEQAVIQIARLQLGEETIELLDFLQDGIGDPIPADSKSNDLWFQHIAIVTNDMDEAYAILKRQKVQHVSTAPQTLPDYIPAAAGIKAFYFRDPDGHNLEIIYFPPGKGNPKWQTSGNGPFLGIDHTAIGVSDTEKGLEFYRDILGLQVAGHSENFGTEQEHLNQVFGAHLMITGLSAGEGIGIEFLEYISPPGGKEYPIQSDSYDLWHWHTIIHVDDLNTILQQLIEKQYQLVSNGLVSMNGTEGEHLKSCIVRDFDGHAILLLETANSPRN